MLSGVSSLSDRHRVLQQRLHPTWELKHGGDSQKKKLAKEEAKAGVGTDSGAIRHAANPILTVDTVCPLAKIKHCEIASQKSIKKSSALPSR